MSIVHKFNLQNDHYYWDKVQAHLLEEEGLQSVTKHVLIGEQEKAPNYIMRYFSLEAGGHTRLERHPQEHEILVLRGMGTVQIGEESHALKPLDAIFIEGNELHQFNNTGSDPFGFICIIPNPKA